MNSKVEIRFQQLESQKKQLIAEIKPLSDAQKSFSDGDGVWSINQVLMHLLQVEQGVLQYMQKNNPSGTIPPAGLGALFRSKILTAILKSPLRFKAPKRIGAPSNSVSFAEILHTWDETRQQLHEFLGSLPEMRVKSAIFNHPRAGKIDIFQTMKFIGEHIKHHKKQIRRIQNAQHFPRQN